MWRDLPPLSSLKAFAAFCDAGSVVEAGAQLNVSHAAISQQLRALETHLSVSLLDRAGRSLKLTQEGEILAKALAEGFGAIAQGVAQITGADAARALHVTCTPSFAANWLMPRLASFRQHHPQIDIMINPTPQLADPAPGQIDVALRYGKGPWAGLESSLLFKSSMAIVGSPDLIGDSQADTPNDLAKFPWLQELGTSESTTWLETHGVCCPDVPGTMHLPGNLMLDAARSGQGIAVTARVSIEEDLRAGRLKLLYEDSLDSGYHIVTTPGIMRPPVKAFVTWLKREANK